jgi:RHS repeat-associated protein
VSFTPVQVDTYTYDGENRLVEVRGARSARYIYDGDGKLVVSIENGITTTLIGEHYEWRGAGASMTRYYYAGATRLAMRVGAGTGTEGVQFLLGDHLGSTSVTADGSGGSVVRQGYTPWGAVRYQVGGTLSTPYRFTGQRESSSTGLQWFRSRWYDPFLNRFLSPDSIVPDPYNPQDWDRYSYVRNNPIKYVDPSGHNPCKYSWGDPECSTVPKFHGYKNYSKYQLANYHQTQSNHPTGCGPYSLAMGSNLNSNSNVLQGTDVEEILEQNFMKPKGYGIPSWGFKMGVHHFNPGQKVTAKTGATLEELKTAVDAGKVVIVAVAWQTNGQIFADISKASVGHYMVFVGYDEEQLYFLDSGYYPTEKEMVNSPLRSYGPQEFEKIWLQTSNVFIFPGSMYTINSSNSTIGYSYFDRR